MINWGNFKGFFSTGIPSDVLNTSLGVSALVIVAMVLVGVWHSCSLKVIWRRVLWVLLAEYLFVVACSTVFFRGVQSFTYARLELMPFWTYKAVVAHIPGVSVWDIVLNVVLFLPLGFLLKLIYHTLPLSKTLLIAVVGSLCIETCQYVFEKGIAQIDDVMHNTIGAGLGWGIAKALLLLTKSDVTRNVL